MADLHRLLDGSPTTDPATRSRSILPDDQDYFSSPPTQHASLPSEHEHPRVGSSVVDVSLVASGTSSLLGLDCSLGPVESHTPGTNHHLPAQRAQLDEWQHELNSDRNPLASPSNVSSLPWVWGVRLWWAARYSIPSGLLGVTSDRGVADFWLRMAGQTSNKRFNST